MAALLTIIRILGFTGLLRLVLRLLMDRRVPLGLKLVIPAAIAYIISPFDLVPDLFPALGHIDDISVAILALVIFLAFSPKDVVSEHVRRRRSDSIGGRDDDDRQSGPNVIEGKYRFEDDDSESAR